MPMHSTLLGRAVVVLLWRFYDTFAYSTPDYFLHFPMDFVLLVSVYKIILIGSILPNKP
jgi:hypothetical protein